MIYQSFQHLKGMNAGLSPFLQPDDSPVILNGVNPSYQLGALLKDLGYYRVGGAVVANKSPTGLFNFRQTGAEKILTTINNSGGTNLTLKYNNAGTWSDISIGAAWDAFEDCKVEMESFINYCFFVGYDSTDAVWLPVASLTSTTFSTATNVTDMPNAKYIKRYRDRLYLANCYYSGAAYPYRVYFSSVPTAGAITWTPASNFIDVDFGEQLTGLGSHWDRLIAFTESSAYLYDQSSFKKVWDTGCSAHRTIQNSGAYMYWINYDGLWRSSGGQPENIGGPINKFIFVGTPRNFFSTIVDQEYRTFIGTVTVDGDTYTNCEIIFNIQTQMYMIRENAHVFTTYAKFMDSNGIPRVYMGATDGNIYQKSKYYDSTIYYADGYVSGGTAGSAIHADVEFAPIKLGDLNTKYNIKTLTAYSEKAQGVNLSMRVLDKNLRALTPYKKIGQLTQYMNNFDVNVNKGVLMQLRLSEYSSLPYFSLYGFELDGVPYSKLLKRANN